MPFGSESMSDQDTEGMIEVLALVTNAFRQ